ncbi:MAG: hypothetical protein IJR44_01200, partial [Neisseriaceae bacterium]|nr:hypothetical protein [Neisseriaceae bacterium]
VCVLNERQAPQPQPKWYAEIEKWAGAIFDSWGNKAINPELGEIELTHRSIKDSNAHKLNPFKAEAYRSIKDVIEQGVVFAQTKVGKEEHYFIAAPVTIDNQIDLVSVLVQKNLETQTMYLHSVMIREKILEKDFEQKNTLGYPSSVADTLKNEPEPQGKLYPRDTGRILQKFLKVNIHQLEIELNQQIEQEKGNKMDEMKKQTVSGNLNDAVSWFDTQEQFQWSNGATNYYKQEAQFIVDTVTKYPHRDGEPFVIVSAFDSEDYPHYPPLSGTHKMSIQAAEMIFTHLDNEISRNGEEFVQRFEICNADGVAVNSINLRQYELGRNNGGLFCYIASCGISYHDDLSNLSQYLTQETRNGLIERIAQQAEVDNAKKAVADEIYLKIRIEESKKVRNIFGERLQQQILQQDKTVEQHLSEMVDEVVAIANRHNQEQSQVESVSGNLKDEVKAIHQELAAQSLEFQFTHKDLADRTAAFNQELLKLTPEQLKELQPYFEQHKAIQTLQDLYKQTGDNARLDEMQEHNRLIEWKIHNKVEAYLGKHIDYSDMDYYKGIKTGEELQQMMNDGQRLPENANRHI